MNSEERNNIDWRKVGFKSFNNYFTKNISRSELMAYVHEAYDIAEITRTKFQNSGGWQSNAPQ